ncbi:uncharacterized protein CANTADRAFT_23378 [Suhomyces tanzawaensis NRRL Y-17324]|uniref:intramembrane prenyl-peptidase Rce1 n=1 Tax=Suhomyces tanzawaensis NRRL Y-17324 TaxID=984487 RepID=A0A1E4SCY3_9ASCO|nr:uncharacterized protein CANTADRAFT_23378 [Suhomyces tanzawaensis NRRL Y-17324]ODV77242.1 hypothetical protein CANTADRAFT_23378 [Suhomyces tanzawaensis NRRL Y-17324]
MHILLAISIASSYVFSIYFRQPAALRGQHRDQPAVIRHRIARVTMLCAGWVVVVPALLHYWDGLRYYDVIRELGLVPGMGTRTLAQDVANIAKSALLISVLYLAVIVDYLRQGPSLAGDVRDGFLTLHGFRDHVFAPLSEELIYRSLIITVLVHGGVSRHTQLLLWTSLLFGIAHVHHGVVLVRTTKLPVGMVVANAGFQTVYTTVFGMVAIQVYLWYGSVWCPAVVHAACNLMGFPAITVASLAPWQALYYVLLLAGVVLFSRLIGLF